MSKIRSDEDYYAAISETKSYLFGSEEGRDLVDSIIENFNDENSQHLINIVNDDKDFSIFRYFCLIYGGEKVMDRFFSDILTPVIIRSFNRKTSELAISVACQTFTADFAVSFERITFPIEMNPPQFDSIIRCDVGEVVSDSEKFLRNFFGKLAFVAGPTIDKNGKLLIDDIFIGENLDSLSRMLVENGLASVDETPDNIGWKNYQNICEFRLMTKSDEELL